MLAESQLKNGCSFRNKWKNWQSCSGKLVEFRRKEMENLAKFQRRKGKFGGVSMKKWKIWRSFSEKIRWNFGKNMGRVMGFWQRSAILFTFRYKDSSNLKRVIQNFYNLLGQCDYFPSIEPSCIFLYTIFKKTKQWKLKKHQINNLFIYKFLCGIAITLQNSVFHI